jgi:predicted dehydrogenase
MSTPIRVALIGAGAIAKAYEAAIQNFDGAYITAVCDVRRDAAEAFAGRMGAQAYDDVRDLVDSAAFDAAIVCTPPAYHEEVSKLLLASGHHVLCEKPLATSAAAARRMMETALASGRILTMASKFRYVTDVRRARELVQSGAIGELVFIENAFTSRVDMRSRWNADPAVSGGGVLIDNGTHAVDLLRYFLGNICDIQVVEGLRIQGLAVEDTVRLFVHNEGGVMGASDLSWSIDKKLESFLRIYGSEGTIVVGWQESKMLRHSDAAWDVFGSGYDKIQAFRDQLANFCDAIAGKSELVVTPADALASVDVIQAAYAALHQARWQRIETELPTLQVS